MKLCAIFTPEILKKMTFATLQDPANVEKSVDEVHNS
jgi:hypothetical protein